MHVDTKAQLVASSRRFRIATLLRSRYFWIGMTFLVIQQAIVAASVYFLAAAASNLDTPKTAIFYLLFYILCATTFVLPAQIYDYYVDLLQVISMRTFQFDAARKHPFTATDFAKTGYGARMTAIYANTGPGVITETCNFIFNSTGVLLNTLFTAAAITIFVDYTFAFSYLISFGLCLAYVYSISGFLTKYAEVTTKNSVDVVAQAERMWPNVSLGNRLSELVWTQKLSHIYDKYFLSVKKEAFIRHGSSSILFALSYIPTVIMLFYSLLYHHDEKSSLAAVLVTVPRMFVSLSNITELTAILLHWSHLKGRMSVFDEFFATAVEESRKIDFAGLTVLLGDESLPIESAAQLASTVLETKCGRFTLRGVNGSGKTTLLLYLKDLLGREAFYLPPAAVLSFANHSENMSTGERKFAEIESVLTDANVRILLLDEWDANLDAENMNKIDLALNRAAKQSIVVEVRHR